MAPNETNKKLYICTHSKTDRVCGGIDFEQAAGTANGAGWRSPRARNLWTGRRPVPDEPRGVVAKQRRSIICTTNRPLWEINHGIRQKSSIEWSNIEWSNAGGGRSERGRLAPGAPRVPLRSRPPQNNNPQPQRRSRRPAAGASYRGTSLLRNQPPIVPAPPPCCGVPVHPPTTWSELFTPVSRMMIYPAELTLRVYSAG